MKKLDKKLMLEYVTLIVIIGIMLFISINTSEAKKLVNYVFVILNPFIYGFCIAFILNLVSNAVDKLFKKRALNKGREYDIKKHRKLSVTVSIFIFAAFAALVIGLIIPNLKDTVVSLYKKAPDLWEKFLNVLDGLKTKEPKLASVITTVEKNLDNYFDKIVTYFKKNTGNILNTALSKLKDASNIVINFGLGFIIAIFVLLKKEEVKKEFKLILKTFLPVREYRRALYVIDLANKKFQIYFKYNLIQALITGCGTFLFMLVLNMPNKISISLIVTVTQLIPIVGAIVGTAIGTLLVFAQDGNLLKAILFLALCVLVQQLVEKLINPHLMGKELDMPGIITFLAIVIGGKQFGLIGLICSVPLVSTVYDLYRFKIRPAILEKNKRKKE
ncbi:MAG: AI-2E family transporter [Eubacterium sp.]|nr:AI-2E family transporter [Eubacterium sp.]